STQLRRIFVAAHGSDIEPFVVLHQIDRHAGPRRKDHAKAEAIFRARWLDAPRSHFAACHFAPHFDRRAPCNRSFAQVLVKSLLSGLLFRTARSSGENLNDSLSDAMNRK